MINSKAKGSTFERKLAKMLSKWSGHNFVRTPMSGAMYHYHNDSRVISDIVPPSTLKGWAFSIEAKNVECPWDFNTFLEGSSLTLKSHWKQCIDDATRENLVPLLVFTKNYRDIYMMVDTSTWDDLDLDLPHLSIKVEDISTVVCKFSSFLDAISCEDLIKKNLKRKI